jgi:predicted ATPase/transcriptional regulator with XRE-family HTH domain
MTGTGMSEPESLGATRSGTTAFGAALRSMRLAAGLSQGALAERAGLSEKAVGALERGDRTTPRPATVVLLADAIGASPAERDRLLAAARAEQRPTKRDRLLAATGAERRPNDTDAASVARHGLLVPPTPLLGRQQDIAAVSQLVSPSGGAARLVTLVGPGGVGKTRVALAVALELVDAFADDVWFVDLSPLRDYRLVAASVARALDVRESGGRSAHELLIDALREREVLLVLDNFEHVLDAAPLIADLLSRCPRLSVLVTSRTALRLRAERRFMIEPLSVPRADGPHTLETITRSSAVQLFVDRAQAIVPDFQLTPSNRDALGGICRRLDGLPLAIELAAARTAVLLPDALLARLQQPHTSELGDLPPRQRTMQATISWSYDLLTPEEQTLFACLAVFVGGWTLESAEAVCANVLPTGVDLRGLMLGLVESSLVRRTTDAASGQARFGMLETIREDASRRLVASGQAAKVRDRHLAFFLAEADQIEPHLHGPDQATWAECLEREHDNLRAALSWSATGHQPLQGLQLATTLRYFWYMHGHHREGRERLAHALEHGTSVATDVRGRALGALGYLEAMQAEYGLAQRHLNEALALARGANDLPTIVLAQRYLGMVAIGNGDPHAARAHLEASFGLYTALGQDEDAGAFLMYLGDAAFADGDSDLARSYFEESRDRLRQLGNMTVLPYPIRRLGHLALLRGDVSGAVKMCLESLSLNRAVGDPQGIAACLVALSSVAAACNASERAARLLGSADALLSAGGIELFAADRLLYRQTQDRVRRELGETTFGEHWTAGQIADPEPDIASFGSPESPPESDFGAAAGPLRRGPS